MSTFLHKNILIKNDKAKFNSPSFSIYGKLIGWTDGEKIIDCNVIQDVIKDYWIKKGPDSVAELMRGIVGPCIIEVKDNNDFWFFSSCASGGFYWILLEDSRDVGCNYLVSNNEGKFLSHTFQKNLDISDGALMNAVLSHQSVIRPIFDGLINNTKRCPPGFYVNFSTSETKIQSYLINDETKTRNQQDIMISKKMKCISDLYNSYCKMNKVDSILAFSGGIDSTALLLANKDMLNMSFHGYYKYKNKGKTAEMEVAAEIAKSANCKINFIMPDENFSISEIQKNAETGLSIMMGVGYLKHGFRSNPYPLNANEILILNGQNSDTMFHVDTFSASSFMKGIARKVIMAKGIYLRFQTTMLFYWFWNLFEKNNSTIIPPRVFESFVSLSEHKTNKENLPKGVIQIIQNYKKNTYFLPYASWLKNEFYPKLSTSSLSNEEKVNQAYRFARWLRTIGNFHQQFKNISSNEKTIICTPYSEGPIAFELLSYKLGFKDVLYPKMFLHKYIYNKLGLKYGNIRKKILNDKLINYIPQIIYYSYKLIIRIAHKFIKNIQRKNYTPISSRPKINDEDLNNLREILGHKNGIVERFLLKYIDDDQCSHYLNYLYDCIELKTDTNKVSDEVGRHICRLVN
jgi:hypothetical protein